jgi:hypothetical protein
MMDNIINKLKALILSLYGSLEASLIKLVEKIECRAKIEYKQYCIENRKRKNIYAIKGYIETYSNIRFNCKLFRDIEAIKTIRNTFIHNGDLLDEKFQQKRYLNSIKKFTIMSDLIGSEIYISADFECVDKTFKPIKAFLGDITEQEFIILS